ncbi:MAG: hypothetical protein B7Z77_08500 [Acidocella sp. 20-58-15]|nr:MAG: hypothetical protein B7Z77_08500 [Acidocella sp. 20-58-15]
MSALDKLKHQKPGADATPAVAAQSAARDGADKRKGLIVRLNTPAWAQLKTLAIEHELSAHDLLIEGINLIFQKYEKPPIASSPGKAGRPATKR